MKRDEQAIYRDYAHAWWDGSARFLRMLRNQVHPRLAYFDRVAPDWKGQKVLDLGCGGGFMAEALAGRGARVIGIDPSDATLKAARQHALTNGLVIDYRQGVGEAIPLEDHAVDRVVCVDVLEHVQDVPRVITEIRRVLRPGGIFFFDTINRTWLARLVVVHMAEDLLRIMPHGTHDPHKFIRPEELRHYLKNAGFSCAEKFAGMVFSGVDRHLDFRFKLAPVTQVLYLGHAW